MNGTEKTLKECQDLVFGKETTGKNNTEFRGVPE